MKLTSVLLFLTAAISWSQTSQPNTSCSISVTGNQNKSTVTCTGLDKQSAEGIRDIVERTRGNAAALKELSSKVEAIRKEVAKAPEPIPGILFYADIVLPSDNPDVKEYMAKLDEIIQRFLSTKQPSPGEFEGLVFLNRADRKPIAVMVEPRSSLYPTRGAGGPLGDVLTYGFGIEFQGQTFGASLSMSVHSRETTRRLKYDINEHSLVIEYIEATSDSKTWLNSGEFTSVGDLQGAKQVALQMSRNIDATMDRNVRSKAIVQGAWFSSFGINTPLGRRFFAERQNIRRLDKSPQGDSSFGNSFANLFRLEPQPLVFSEQYFPDGDTVGTLDALVSKFETGLAADHFIIPPKPILVRMDSGATELSTGIDSIELPRSAKHLQASVLWGVAFDLFDCGTDPTEAIATYLVADFLNSSKVEMDGFSLDIAGDSPKPADESTTLSLAEGLWQLRRTVGAAATNKLVSSALRKFRGGSIPGDDNKNFASLVKAAATPATATRIQAIWSKFGLDAK